MPGLDRQPLSQRIDACTYFGLHHLPFTREIAVADRFHLPDHDDLAYDIQAAVDDHLSAAVISPAGAGKTVLLRTVEDALPKARFRIHYIKVTDLSKRDFCREIAAAMGASTAGYYGALVRQIQDRCQSLLGQESLRPVLLIDDCHDARPEVLSILRVIANFEMDSRLVVSMVLCGQSPLRAMLRRDILEDVSRRLSLVGTLPLLGRPETFDYIDHRLRICGGEPELIDRHAREAVFEATQGNMRAIDALTLRALQLAAQAGLKGVDLSVVQNARAQVWP